MGDIFLGSPFSYQRQATVYSPTGWIRDLPLLKEKRQHHACAKFYDENGKKVTLPPPT